MKKKLRFKGMLMLICLMLIIGFWGTDVYASSKKETKSEHTDEWYGKWKTYSCVNNKGKSVTKYYQYPKIAKKYGIPESCFRSPGIKHHKGGFGNISYTIICSQEYEEETKRTYIDCEGAIYINDCLTPKTNSKGDHDDGYLHTDILYVSPGMWMRPTKNNAIDLQLMNNTDLICSYSSQYKVEKPLNFKGDIASLVQAVVDVGTGNLTGLVTSTLGWAETICKEPTKLEKEGLKNVGATRYGGDKEKIKSIGVRLNDRICLMKNNFIHLDYTEIYPEDSNYTKTNLRKAKARFIFSFNYGGQKKEVVDEYKIEYKIKDDGKINFKEAKNKKLLTVSSWAGGEYTGKKQTPKVKVEYRGLILKEGKDYVVKYKNNVLPGNAKIIVSGKGIYTGSITNTYNIYISRPELTTSNTNISEKYRIVKISLTDKSKVTGYEIYKRTENSNKFKLVKTTKDKTFTDGNIELNKKYYYKARAYIVIKGKKYYSAYSNCVLI